MIAIRAPLKEQDIEKLNMGDEVLINGVIYGARDAAHQRIYASLAKGESLPFNLKGQIIYYVGPCPAPPGRVIGAAGPTTSTRMDSYTPFLLQNGLKAMIGKGNREESVVAAMRKYGAVYLAAVGGAGAYLSKRIKAVETIAYPELGPEALLKLEVKNFPCIVAIDSQGNNIYTGR